MSDFLLRLLGAPAGDAGTVLSSRLEWHPVFGGGVFVLLVAGALAVAVGSYRRRDVEIAPRRRWVLLGLRSLATLVVAGVFLRPTIGLTVEGLVRQSLVLLFDGSASMNLQDPRTDGADRVRAAIAEGTLSGTGGIARTAPAPRTPAASRLDLLRGVVTNRDLALLDRLGRTFDLRVASFAGELQPLVLPVGGTSTNRGVESAGAVPAVPLAEALRADGGRSAPGTALRELLDRERGRPLGGVVMFTDGIWNGGLDPREAAEVARDAGVPIHVVGLGTTAPRDVQVVDLSAAAVSFVQDEVPIQVRLRTRGLSGESLKLALRVDAEPAEEREVRIEGDGEVVVPLKYTPSRTGDFELSVETPARSDEILTENNRQTRRLRVIDDRIRVLLVEQSPRWEFRYLQALLMRDRRVDLKCVLFDGDSAITRTPGSPYLDEFPGRREDLYGYDLVVFGDVDPKNFTPAQLDVLTEFVARSAGSFLMIAGRRFSPWGFRDTALERMLPVEFERLPPGSATVNLHDRPVKLALTPEGGESVLLRLSDDAEENARRWEALPPLFWVAPVLRAKPAAQVLVVDATREDPAARVPVVAMQQYGVGQCMFVGTDNLWRWRRNEGEQFYVSVWGRIVQRLAINHLLTGSRRTQLSLDRTTVLRGDKIAVTGRLFTSAFEPLSEPVVRARWEAGSRAGASGATTNAGTAGPAGGGGSGGGDLLLRSVPDQPGVYRGEIVANTPGRYRVTLGDEAPASVDFTVEERLVEAGETAMQESVMREWAGLTAGEFFREEDVHRLPDVARSRAQRVESRLAIEVWMSPFYFAVALVLFGLEWLLRKLWQLK